MQKVQHFVITRFNLKIASGFSVDKSGVSTQSDDWLSHRFDLFERYCLPSLAAQTNKDFIWFVFFDESTSETYRQRMEKAQQQCPQLRACYIPDTDIHSVMNRAIDEQTDVLITTRIDNDDAFREDALAVIRQQLDNVSQDTVINLRFGYSYDGHLAEVFSQKYNPFSSLIEFRKPDGFMTIFGEHGHGKIHKIARVKQIKTGPHWLMVVHDRNVANKMPGEYKYEKLWKPHRLKRFIKKYLLHRIRSLFRPAAFRKKYTIEELAKQFHVRS